MGSFLPLAACDKKGDKVLLSDGKYCIIVVAKIVQCEKITTCNFEGQNFHTYYVGTQGILVHNNACEIPTKDLLLTGKLEVLSK